MIDNGSEVCRPVELHGLQALVVRLQDALDAVTVRVLYVPILQKSRQTSISVGHRRDSGNYMEK